MRSSARFSLQRLLLFFLFLLFIFGLIWIFAKSIGVVDFSNKPKSMPPVKVTATPAAALTPLEVQTQPSEVHSSDGTMKLTMQSSVKIAGKTTYTFYLSDINGGNRKLLFTKLLTTADTMAIPPNTFSPDNKYIFLSSTESGVKHVPVLKTSGEVFANGIQFEDVAILFLSQKTDNVMTEVTGWDSPTLLHVTTNGPSYWFDVETQNFIQLARR